MNLSSRANARSIYLISRISVGTKIDEKLSIQQYFRQVVKFSFTFLPTKGRYKFTSEVVNLLCILLNFFLRTVELDVFFGSPVELPFCGLTLPIHNFKFIENLKFLVIRI